MAAEARSALVDALTPAQRDALDQLDDATRAHWARADTRDPIVLRMAADRAFRDRFLLRFLQRDNYDLAKTTKRLGATFEWRVTFGLDAGPIERKELLDDERTCPVYNLPPFKAKNGDCLFFCWVAIMNPSLVNSEKHVRYIVSIMDEAIQRMGDGERFLAIMNCANVSWAASSSPSAWSPVLHVMRQHYPELIRSLIMVNTATFFRMGFALVRPFIGHKTADRFTVLGSDWSKKIGHLIDPEQLPAQWGEPGRYQADWGSYGRRLQESTEEVAVPPEVVARGALYRNETAGRVSSINTESLAKDEDEDAFEDAPSG